MSTQDDGVEVEQLVTLARAAGDDDPCSGLSAAVRLRRELERLEVVQVRWARASGLTWEQIAAALGVSRQAVHKKHDGRRLLTRRGGEQRHSRCAAEGAALAVETLTGVDQAGAMAP